MMNMKALALSLAALTIVSLGAYYISSSDDSNHVLSTASRFETIAQRVNGNPKSSWQAVSKPTIAHDSETLKRMFSLVIDEIPANFDKMPAHTTPVEDLPDNFDGREQFPNCNALKQIRDQSSCGSCWAFGAASAMSDRICSQSDQKDQRLVSTEDILECCDSCGYGCNGGYLYSTWSYWKSTGVVTGGVYADNETCKPYAFPPCNHHSQGPYEDCGKKHYSTPSCKRKCSSPTYNKDYKNDKIFASTVYDVDGDADTIRQEIFENGSVEAAFSVYEDFLLYKKGVYVQTTGSYLGGHAIKIIGWGIENDLKYWLCVNSWNESWGDNGTFKILRGEDHCGIEGDIVAGMPKF